MSKLRRTIAKRRRLNNIAYHAKNKDKTMKDIDWVFAVVKYAQANPKANEMPCPKCGNPMKYAVSNYNGHVHGKCDNCNIEFMQ